MQAITSIFIVGSILSSDGAERVHLNPPVEHIHFEPGFEIWTSKPVVSTSTSAMRSRLTFL